MTIFVESNLDVCASIWHRLSKRSSFFGDWNLRVLLANHYGMKPFFLVNDQTETVLPSGLSNGKLYFYGGLHYNERNGFLGDVSGAGAIFSYLKRQSYPFRFISWDSDPYALLPEDCRQWNVPYNQYWILPRYSSFEEYLENFKKKRKKEILYLNRRFNSNSTVYDGDGYAGIELLIDRFFDHTVRAFRKRDRRCIYEDDKIRQGIKLIMRFFGDKDMVRVIRMRDGDEDVALGVMLTAAEAREAVFLLNLYKVRPASVSNAVVLGVARYCIEQGFELDGMRGGFTLKPKYGFVSEPSFAIVNDRDWKIIDQESGKEGDR